MFLIIEFTFKFNFGGFFLSFNIAKILGSFNCYYNIAKRYGKDNSTCIAAGLFPIIFSCIFAFSKNEFYEANIPINSNGIFDGDVSVNNDIKNNYYESTTSVDEDNVSDDSKKENDKKTNIHFV